MMFHHIPYLILDPYVPLLDRDQSCEDAEITALLIALWLDSGDEPQDSDWVDAPFMDVALN